MWRLLSAHEPGDELEDVILDELRVDLRERAAAGRARGRARLRPLVMHTVRLYWRVANASSRRGASVGAAEAMPAGVITRRIAASLARPSAPNTNSSSAMAKSWPCALRIAPAASNTGRTTVRRSSAKPARNASPSLSARRWRCSSARRTPS